MGEPKPLSKKRFNYIPILMLLPAISFFAVFTFYPFLKSILLSFTATNQKGDPVKWMGLYNYRFLFGQSSFWLVFRNTFAFALIVGVGTFSFAMLLAGICSEEAIGGRVYQTMFAMPMAIASAPASAIAMFFFKQAGLVNQLFRSDVKWLTSPEFALLTVAIVTIWLRIGASFIFLLVGFRAVPREIQESAIIDGAGAARRFFRITVPIASPQVFFVVFLNITGSFKAFGQIKMLTGGGPNNASETLIYSIYRIGILGTRFDRACSYALILFLVIFIITRVQFYLEKKLVFYQ